MQHSNKKHNDHCLRFFMLISLAVIGLSVASEVLVVYSTSSQSIMLNLIDEITNRTTPSSIVISPVSFPFLKEEILTKPNILAIFDITNNLNSQYSISRLCEENLIFHFLVTGSLPYHSKWTFSLASSKSSSNKAFTTTLSYFNWTDVIAISSIESYSNIHPIVSNYSQKIEFFSVSSGIYIQEFVRKNLMKFGSSLFYLFTDKNCSIEIQQTLLSSKMMGSGTGILLMGESTYEPVVNGALAIVEKGKEEADSYEKYLWIKISEMIFILSNVSSPDEFSATLLKRCPDHFCANGFSVINFQGNLKKVVGSIFDENFILNSPVVFPGNNIDIPASQKKILYISANDGITNPGGDPSKIILLYKRGLTLALNNINNGTEILQNFQLKLNDFDCGAILYNESFLNNCFQQGKENLGLAHIVTPNYLVAVGEMLAIAKLNITLPFVEATNIHDDLSNITKYPFFTRISLPSSLTQPQIPLILKAMGWTNIAILYQNESAGISSNYYISQVAAKQKIKIVNNLRIIPALLTRSQLINYKDVFQEIIDTNVRMVVLALNSPLLDYAAELFYDLGMRRGDIIFFTVLPGWLSTVANKDDYTAYDDFAAVDFYRHPRQKVYNDLYKNYGNVQPASSSCLFYDAGVLIGTALDWTINKGNDINDPNVLEAAIRNVKFTGCTGKVYIVKGSNDPKVSSFTIQSNSYNASTGIARIFDIGYFAPTWSKILSIDTPFIYPDGTTNKPGDYRITRTNCPFDDKLKQTFFKGQALNFGICFFIALITIIITFFIWKKWWNLDIGELTIKEEISIPDIVVGITIAVEFL